MDPINKRLAVAHFGGSVAGLARAIGVTAARISQWPNELTSEQQDRVITASWRAGKPLADRRRDPRPVAA